MCIDLVLVRYGKAKRVDCRADLATALGVDHLTLPADPESTMEQDYIPEANECLCHIDFDAIARERNFAILTHAWNTKWACDVVMDDMLDEKDAPTKADIEYLAWKAGRR